MPTVVLLSVDADRPARDHAHARQQNSEVRELPIQHRTHTAAARCRSHSTAGTLGRRQSDEIEQALRQRRCSLNEVLPLELHDRLHNLHSSPGTLQFDILPAPWQHSTSAVIVVLLGCACCESPLHALFGQQHLWEIIFSFIPLNVSQSRGHVFVVACRDLTGLLHRCEWTGRLPAPRMSCAYAGMCAGRSCATHDMR